MDCSSAVCARTLLAYSSEGGASDLESLPTSASFTLRHGGWTGQRAVAFLRENFDGTDGAWLGFRAGNGQANHNDLDAGDW